MMLALVEQNTRTHPMSMDDLKKKLKGILSGDDVEEAILWLAGEYVRLVTRFLENNILLYELAHEQIIPPLLAEASKGITDGKKAEQLLDRRVNEWLGNNRSRRYLLTFREWYRIRRSWKPISLENQKDQKQTFISLSRRRFTVIGFCSTLFLITGSGGYAAFQWYQRRPETQMENAQERLITLLGKNKDFQASVFGVALLSTVPWESAFAQKMRRHVTGLEIYNQTRILIALARNLRKL